MEVVPLDSDAEVAALAADTIEALVRSRPSAVLGLATGSSPVATYAELVARHRAGAGPSYDEVRAFLLDEYVGLPPGHPQSYRATIARELTDDLGLPADRVHGPDPTDVPTAGAAYEAQLAGPAVSTSRSSASAATATWRSTSPARRSRRPPGSRPSPS